MLSFISEFFFISNFFLGFNNLISEILKFEFTLFFRRFYLLKLLRGRLDSQQVKGVSHQHDNMSSHTHTDVCVDKQTLSVYGWPLWHDATVSYLLHLMSYFCKFSLFFQNGVWI